MSLINWTTMRVGWVVFLLAVSTASYGQDGSHCLNVRWDDNRIYFENRCDEWITVFYCGDSRYRSKRCGDGKRADQRYYTHSKVLRGGNDSSLGGVENIKYAVCMGNYGFGDKGFTSDMNGAYGCGKR